MGNRHLRRPSAVGSPWHSGGEKGDEPSQPKGTDSHSECSLSGAGGYPRWSHYRQPWAGHGLGIRLEAG